jgi:hypothetical protein
MPDIERIQSTRWVNSRRSQRVVLRLPVAVRDHVEDKHRRVETSHTLVVNAHGALIVLGMKVQLRQPLVLENLLSGKQERCHVVHVGERQSEKNEIGVEFAAPAPRFWDIDFPPADWKPPVD